MKKICLLAAALLALVAILMAICYTPQPVHEGKPLDHWLSGFYPSSFQTLETPSRQESQEVLQHIGAKAVPHLRSMLRCRDSRLRLQVVALAKKYNWLPFKFRPPAEYVQFAAAVATRELGPVAKDAIPELVDLLREGDWWVRAVAASALGSMGEDVDPAVLCGALKDNHHNVRESVCRALEKLGTLAHKAIPALEISLNDPVPQIRAGALDALLAIGKNDRVRLPQLLAQLQDNSSEVRARALRHVLQFAGDASVTNAVHLLLNDSHIGVRFAATNILIRIGPDGESRANQVVMDTGPFRFENMPLATVLQIYGQTAKTRVEIPPEVHQMFKMITIQSHVAMPSEIAMRFFEDEILKQAGVALEKSEDGRITARRAKVK